MNQFAAHAGISAVVRPTNFPRAAHQPDRVLGLRVLSQRELHGYRNAPFVRQALNFLPSLGGRLALHRNTEVGVVLEPLLFIPLCPRRNIQFADLPVALFLRARNSPPAEAEP
jgi:hypothetical protein